MNRSRGLVNLLLIACIATAPLAAQVGSPFFQHGEPFNLKEGSTFSASGGKSNTASKAERDRSRIQADLSEVQALIRRNHVNSSGILPSNITKHAIDGMLKALDPHSNFYDRNEWQELLDDQQSGYTGIGATIANYQLAGLTDTYILSTFPGSPAARSGFRSVSAAFYRAG